MKKVEKWDRTTPNPRHPGLLHMKMQVKEIIKNRVRTIYRMMRRSLRERSYASKLISYGSGSFIDCPLRVDNPETIRVGDNVYVGCGSWLLGSPYGKESLEIGSGSAIGHFAHIVAHHRIVIGEKVLIADKVFISDCTHEFQSVDRAIIDQPVRPLGEVIIGDETWIGENVSILGASIGRHCVVGANSVVTHDVPDYSVVVGAPAKVISCYSFKEKKWMRME